MSAESRCHDTGITGNCGEDCEVYKEGLCTEPEDIDEWKASQSAAQDST